MSDGTRSVLVQFDGTYIINSVPNGSYQLTATRDGYAITPNNFSNPVTVASANISDRNFTAVPAATDTFTIRGRVIGSSGTAGRSVRVTLFGSTYAETITQLDGSYSFQNIPRGSNVTIGVSRYGYSYTPQSIPLTNVSRNYTDLNFAAQSGVATNRIYGYVQHTSPTIPDSTPYPQPNVVVNDGHRAAITGADGRYELPDVPVGSYNMVGTLAGHLVTPQNFHNPLNMAATSFPNYPIGPANFSATYAIAPEISYHPLDRCFDLVGSSARVTFGVGVYNNPLPISYQWQRSINNGSWHSLSGKTSPFLEIRPVLADNGNRYRVIVSNAVGTVTSNPATLTVLPNIGACPVGGGDNGRGVPDLPPGAIITASDGTSEKYVEVYWLPSVGATSYNIYRSQSDKDLGELLADGITSAIYKDRTAVPGIQYFYRVVAENSQGVGVPSPADLGYRKNPTGIPDCDGDGVADANEALAGTLVCDAGSVQSALKTPIFASYNLFDKQFAFAELAAGGETQLKAKLTLYNSLGDVVTTISRTIEAGEQFDVSINELVPPDKYGLLRIDFNENDGAILTGRMSHYRFASDFESIAFAYAREFKNPSRGPLFATCNTIDPQGVGDPVHCWISISNVDNKPRDFVVRIYDQLGDLLSEETVNVGSRGQVDTAGGHQFGEGVFLIEASPSDGQTRYHLAATRFSKQLLTGEPNFAFAVEGRAGTGDKLYLPITNQVSDGWYQGNWVELSNTREKAVEAQVKIRSALGEVLSETKVTISAKGQVHVPAGYLLAEGTVGSVVVRSKVSGAIVAQSMVYFHDRLTGSLQTAYPSNARIRGPVSQVGTFNLFLEMGNQLTLIDVEDNVAPSCALTLRSFDELVYRGREKVRSKGTLRLRLDNEAEFGTSPDTYGVLKLDCSSNDSIVAENLRIREVPIGGKTVVEYAMPTAVQ